MAIAQVNDTHYHVNNVLNKFWEKHSLKKMIKHNSDLVIIVDGRERIGKSTFVFQQMGILEPNIFKTTEKFLSRVCIDAEEFNRTVRKTKNGVVTFDESFRGFSSRSALSKTNKLLIQTLMEMGQNNNIVFIVLPSFYLLDIYPAMIRSNALFHIKLAKKNRLRVFSGFNSADKNEMYRNGVKKGWNYKPTPFRGKFPKQFPGGDEFEKAYNKKKSDAFVNLSDSMTEESKIDPVMVQRNKILYGMYENKLKGAESLRKQEVWLKSKGVDLTSSNLSLIYKEIRGKRGKMLSVEPQIGK